MQEALKDEKTEENLLGMLNSTVFNDIAKFWGADGDVDTESATMQVEMIKALVKHALQIAVIGRGKMPRDAKAVLVAHAFYALTVPRITKDIIPVFDIGTFVPMLQADVTTNGENTVFLMMAKSMYTIFTLVSPYLKGKPAVVRFSPSKMPTQETMPVLVTALTAARKKMVAIVNPTEDENQTIRHINDALKEIERYNIAAQQVRSSYTAFVSELSKLQTPYTSDEMAIYVRDGMNVVAAAVHIHDSETGS